MKRAAIALVLVIVLLLAAAGFPGCGKGNTITSIAVTPAEPFIAKRTSLQLFVTAFFSDGMYLTSWTQVTWQSSDPDVATVNGSGLVTAVTEGTAVITAIDKAHPSISTSVTAVVIGLESIIITPAIVSIPVGTVQPFTAAGIYTAETLTWPPDLTPLVSWASSSADIAVISNDAGSKGIATAGTTTGITTITATYPTSTITGTATLTVTVP